MISLRFTATVPIGRRRRARREIRRQAWRRGLRISVEEDRALLTTVYFVMASGEDRAIHDYRAQIQDYVDSYDEVLDGA